MPTITEEFEVTCKLGHIQFQLITNKPVYNRGDQIQVKGIINNMGSDVYSHKGSSTCDNSLYFSISKTNSGGDEWSGEGSILPKLCTDDLREYQLNPQAKLEKNATFQVNHDRGVYTLMGRYGNLSLAVPIVVQ
jgi:hypothetical protein